MQETRLKGEFKTTDRRLDRLVQFDERSRAFPVRALVEMKKPRGYTWQCPVNLDQGSEGACVGFAWAHELAARPSRVTVTNEIARNRIYREAQKIDEWPGEAYEGTSVLAGAKVVKQLGGIEEYRWAFGLEDLILAVGYAGPAVLGVNWYTGMFDADRNGYVNVAGNVAGGHAILCHGVNVKSKFFWLFNSWGASWGILGGRAKITFDDMDRLLHEQGEACIPVGRKLVRFT